MSRLPTLVLFHCAVFVAVVQAETLWIEGESPVRSTMNRHPWWYDKVKKELLSGGDWISNFDDGKKIGEADYEVRPKTAGMFAFWVRANPTAARLEWRLDEGEWTAIDFESKAKDVVNVADDGKPDLRFIGWTKVGDVKLPAKKSTLGFRMTSENSRHGAIDCFVLTTEPFAPRGKRKPGEEASLDTGDKDWFSFAPPLDPFDKDAALDLRSLNEKTAGDGGFIQPKKGQFIHGKTGKPVRFWGVNGPSTTDPAEMRREARLLAKHGVNLVRKHGPIFDERGDVDPRKVQNAIHVVETMKAEGIYTQLSFYFPLWFKPAADNPWLQGYDGNKHPFAAIFFNPDFQAKHREWLKALLTTKSETTGKSLLDEPAVLGVEILNEDSLFFWTFNPEAVPDAQLKIIETRFGEWLKKKHGSFDDVRKAWNDQATDRDAWEEGRVGFRPLWNIANNRTPRDQDTARFLFETQSKFYERTTQFVRELGFKGMVVASNWTTADAQRFGPLEKLSYGAGDFIDRHGYFGCLNQGEAAEWSIRDGHTYVDRSALKFESESPEGPAQVVHPSMDPQYGDLPSMISETAWCRPNRHRGEAPLYYAAYGALQDSDAIVHFAFDGQDWSVKPGYHMQPWTIASPATFGQFQAAALIYRKGLVRPGPALVELSLAKQDLLSLKGTPLPQDASFDELRAKDGPEATEAKGDAAIDPLVHYAGRTIVRFGDKPAPVKVQPLDKWIDRNAKTVASATEELLLDYGAGVLLIDAPQAQGASGDLKSAKRIALKDVEIDVPLDVAHVVVVSLDDQPIAKSKRMLLQVMTEERATGFVSEPAEGRKRKIVSIGEDPWQVRKLEGTVSLKRDDAEKLTVTPIDTLGNRGKPIGTAREIHLAPTGLRYLVERR